jgi:hypothetical protein
MNKHIKDIVSKSVEYANSVPAAQQEVTIWKNHYNTKFAELIIKEACQVMNDHDSFYGEVMMSPLIKEHFGVK